MTPALSTDDKLLNYMVRYQDKHHFPPSVREMCLYLGVASTSTVWKRLRRLEQSGRLIVKREGKRSHVQVPK